MWMKLYQLLPFTFANWKPARDVPTEYIVCLSAYMSMIIHENDQKEMTRSSESVVMDPLDQRND